LRLHRFQATHSALARRSHIARLFLFSECLNGHTRM
jgi:hypothetical protein